MLMCLERKGMQPTPQTQQLFMLGICMRNPFQQNQLLFGCFDNQINKCFQPGLLLIMLFCLIVSYHILNIPTGENRSVQCSSVKTRLGG